MVAVAAGEPGGGAFAAGAGSAFGCARSDMKPIVVAK
jgi:hypothetical protein